MTSRIKSTRLAMRESSALGDLLSMKVHERPVVFYAEDSFTYVQLRGYVETLISRHSIPVRYVTSDPDDPLFGKAPDGMTVHYVDRQLPRLMSGLRSGVVVMTMPDLGVFHVPVPDGAQTFYVFHSLNSAHTSYRAGAFDHYDHFACTGPHHLAELRAIRAGRGLPPAELHEVGYHKLDRIADEYRHHNRSGMTPSVVLAPSWAPANLLEAHGSAIVDRLRRDGFEVVVRPHPQFFHSLYPKGREVIDELTGRFGGDTGVRFEMSISNQESFYRSDLMISDWSGAAFEYALGTLRPVLFVDTPQKLSNDEWSRYGLPAFEAERREVVGKVLRPSELSTIGSVARAMIEDRDILARGLEEARENLVFNFGKSAEVGADMIADLAT